MSDTLPQFFDWPTARQAMFTGWRVRRSGWSDRWLERWSGGLFWLVFPATGASRVVRNTDFGAGEFLAQDWTNLPPSCVTSGTVGGTKTNGCPLPFDTADAGAVLLFPAGISPAQTPPIDDGGIISFP